MISYILILTVDCLFAKVLRLLFMQQVSFCNNLRKPIKPLKVKKHHRHKLNQCEQTWEASHFLTFLPRSRNQGGQNMFCSNSWFWIQPCHQHVSRHIRNRHCPKTKPENGISGQEKQLIDSTKPMVVQPMIIQLSLYIQEQVRNLPNKKSSTIMQ
jgi:hypothetical protein